MLLKDFSVHTMTGVPLAQSLLFFMGLALSIGGEHDPLWFEHAQRPDGRRMPQGQNPHIATGVIMVSGREII
jgi:hypothetical protein